MEVDEAPDDDEVRETYNFAPGSFGAVYRADIPHHGHQPGGEGSEEPTEAQNDDGPKDTKYKLQSMKWGLIPFWTKRQPDYGSMMRTINCRDDSLIEDRGMWTSMKRRKRCIVICQGFYEWLKKGPGGKEKIPHFVKRKDGDLMCFAGLWDCVSYEGESASAFPRVVSV
jgi:putative SOS response-associated peptidase YedK